MIVWETNNQGMDLEDKNPGQEGPAEMGYKFGPDQEAIRELQEKMRARESDDTDSIE